MGVWLVGVLLGGGQADAGATVVWQWDGGSGALTFGWAVAGVGDVDGVPDVVVGAPGGTGSVYVLSGADGQLLWRFDGERKGGYLGWAVAGAGDINGDGVPDVIASACWSAAMIPTRRRWGCCSTAGA